MKVGTILDQIDLGSIALPEFQRGYVWNREQVRGLMHSLYRKYPVGSLMVWVTRPEDVAARGDGRLSPGSVKLLLDGQQRMTSLYGIVRGRPPKFFDGNEWAFKDLYFNVEDEIFEFYAPIKMKDNPLWIRVTELIQEGIAGFTTRFIEAGLVGDELKRYINRLNGVAGILDIDFHIEEVAGEDKTVDVVVDIFNRVNSGGTKLSKGDLALARICAESPDARDDMKSRLSKWGNAGYHFSLDSLLRSINTILTNEARFTALKDVTPTQFHDGLIRAEKAIDSTLNTVASRLGLDHGRVLGAAAALPLLARYVDSRGGRINDPRERDRLLYWYVNVMMWGRYAGSTETVLNQDLRSIEHEDGIGELVGQLRQNRGDLAVHPNDFIGWSTGSRFYPLLYMLTRVAGARDWETGDELRSHVLGKMNQLEVHHIFPKARLYKAGHKRAEVNALANYAFLTKETNLKISDKDPAEYLAYYADRDPDLLASNWIPLDRDLWTIERYLDFLAARRELLAGAVNQFLHGLWSGSLPEPEVEPVVTMAEPVSVPLEVTSIADGEEAKQLFGIQVWVKSRGLPQGELVHEATDMEGNVLGLFDLAWPEGLQVGLSQPVALLLGEDQETEQVANALGFRFFTDPDSFRAYVTDEILGDGGEDEA